MNQYIINCNPSALNDIKENNLIYREIQPNQFSCYVDGINGKSSEDLVSYYGLDSEDVISIETINRV